MTIRFGNLFSNTIYGPDYRDWMFYLWRAGFDRALYEGAVFDFDVAVRRHSDRVRQIDAAGALIEPIR